MTEMTRYEIILENTKLNAYTLFSRIIIAANLVVLGYWMVIPPYGTVRGQYIAIVGAVLLLLGLQFYLRHSRHRFGLHPVFWFLLTAWAGYGHYWVAGVMLVFSVLYTLSTRKLNVEFAENYILYPSFPVKQMEWTQLNNVILKDGLLTIDLKSNKLIQQNINKEETPVSEADFNEFCRARLQASS